MAATTLDTNTPARFYGPQLADDAPVAANTTIPQGALVGANAAGELINAADVVGCTVLGRAKNRMVNATGAAAKIVPAAIVETGVFRWKTSGGNAVTAADLGKTVFVLDNQTVVKTAGTVNAIAAGKLNSIDPNGEVWVQTGL